MSPGEDAVIAAGAGAAAPDTIDAAAALSRLLIASSVMGILVGLAIVLAFGCWMSARFKAVERCLEQIREDGRSPRSGKS